MSTLYIDRRDTELRLDGKSISVRISGQRANNIPLHLLERIIVISHTHLDSRLLGALASSGVTLVLCSPRDPSRWATLIGAAHNDAEIRLAQYRLHHDKTARLALARRLVRAKIYQYRRFFIAALEQRPAVRRALTTAITAHDDALKKIPIAENASSLLGIEGSCARAAFKAYASLVPEVYAFEGRKRRPPPDPVNALLSLTYTLLFSRAHAALYRAGLDPALGIFHETSFGRQSLAADLVELWRAKADQWVWRLLAERTIREHHFKLDKGACLLDKAGRKIYYAEFEDWVYPIERNLRRQTRAFVRHIQRQEKL
ncbi:MAG: CRISPR-associated endonuclease Cas1 [Granulosicoccus sp.]